MDTKTAKQLKRIDSHISKPETGNTQPTTTYSQPETRDPQSASRNPQHATRTPQRPSRNPKHATLIPQRAPRNSQPVFALDLGLIEYREAWKLQEKLVAARVNKSICNDFFLFQEHPAVFTLGRRGGLNHLLVSEAFMKEAGIPVIQIERGGFITYHGPGQLVVYPIINLHSRRLGVKDFVAAMEEAMLKTVRCWDIAAARNPLNSGIWVGNQKMGSIGIALRKGVSYHGLALNVNLDLTPFSWIQPCGLQGVDMTSMRKELGKKLPMAKVRQFLKNQLAAVLGLSFETCKLSDLEGWLREKN